MTNEEKARELQLGYVENGCGDSTDIRCACEEMAEWKDQQFKEYLEKKRAEYMSQRDNANMWSEQWDWAVFHALTCTMHQIINELFGGE